MTSASKIDDAALFYYAMQAITYLHKVPISNLKEIDINIMQCISKGSNCDGVILLLGVNSCHGNLIVRSYHPDRLVKSLPKFSESPDSAIYISNQANPERAAATLNKMSEHYNSLVTPSFQEVADKYEDAMMAEYLEADAKAKYSHEIFMRDHGMYTTVIPSEYRSQQKQG